MEFKAVCTADDQNSAGTHLVTLRDEASGHEIKLVSPLKIEKGEVYSVSISGKGVDKPKPAAPAPKPPVIDKFDAQPEEHAPQPTA